MSDESPDPLQRGIGALVWERLRKRRLRHRVSLFLMLAMTVALFLGVRFAQSLDDPKRLAWFLSLYFVLFLFVIGRALFEMLDILREHIRERESVFKSTFHDGDFADELGRRVGKTDAGSWPE